MKCFVTGGAGVVGRAVVPALVAGGHDVIALTHTPANAPRLERLGARAVVGDIRAPADWIEHAKQADAIVHMAQMTPAGRVSAKAAAAVAASDIAATRALLEAASGASKPFLYTSGAWVYGSSDDATPRDENSATQPYPLVTYKLEGEQLVLDASARGDVVGMVTRPGTVYGPWGMFEEYTLKPNRDKGKAAVLGSGAQIATYLHVDDCGRMYRTLLENPAPGEIFNLGDSEPVAVMTMAREVAQRMDAKAPGKVPGFIIKLATGLIGAPLLGSHRFTSKKFVDRYSYAYARPTYREGAQATVEAYRAGVNW